MGRLPLLRHAAPGLCLVLAACQSEGGDALSDLANLGAKSPPIHNQVAGGDASDPALRGHTDRNLPPPVLDKAEVAALQAERRRIAESLWARANQERIADEQADLYADLAEDYPDSVHAAESRFREGEAAFRAGDYSRAFTALRTYMQIAPVNPYQASVERMVFEGGRRMLEEPGGGLLDVFRSDDTALSMLQFVAQNFPAGNYPDDALWVLGRHFQGEGEHESAMLSFKEILIRYPHSEWTHMTRLALGDTYLERDGGEAYEAGFVDRDPRVALPSPEMAPRAGPVKSALVMGLDQFETFLENVRAEPRLHAEYASHVAYAETRTRQIRAGLAAKDERTARYYRDRGSMQAAQLHARSAARWRSGGHGGASVVADLPAETTAPPAASPPTYYDAAPYAPAPQPATTPNWGPSWGSPPATTSPPAGYEVQPTQPLDPGYASPPPPSWTVPPIPPPPPPPGNTPPGYPAGAGS